MCGIIGWWNLSGAPVDLRALKSAAAVMAHRGPDDEGYVALDPNHGAPPRPFAGPRTAPAARGLDLRYAPPAGDDLPAAGALALGQVRLAIIDLSPRGHQPMCNEDGAIWVTFGGEIYNFPELRDSLAGRGHRFRSQTDTEVLVHGYEEWGEDLFDRLNGMWGLAIWDARRRLLIGARDRLGIKPFYYLHAAGTFAFASEIRPLLRVAATLEQAPQPNGRAIARLIERAQVDVTDETFFTGIRALGPGHYVIVDQQGPHFRRYWDLRPPEPDDTPHDWADELRELLSDAVNIRLRADVPVGTCLSGGLDSSSVIALGSRHLPGAMDAYSVAYDEGESFDERRHMEVVVAATAARHHLVMPDADDLLARLTRVVRAQEEPAAGPGILSQWHVMQLAAQHGAKVLLDGQGGDELFGGYFAFYYPLVWRDLLRAGRPGAAWGLVRAALQGGHAPLEIVGRLLQPLLPRRLYRAARARLGTGGGWDRVLGGDFRRAHGLPVPPAPERFADQLTSRLYWDLTRDILPSLLRYEDRNSMAYSIEARVPLLDYRLVELAFRMPGVVKADGALTKQVLRQAMTGIVPPEILARTDKRGFETPTTIWLRRHHGPALVDLVTNGQAVARGILDRSRTRQTLRAFLDDGRGPGHEIWRLLNLELWLREYFPATQPGVREES